MSAQKEDYNISELAEIKTEELEGFYDILNNTENSHEERIAEDAFWEAYDEFLDHFKDEHRAGIEFLEAAGRQSGKNKSFPSDEHNPNETISQLYADKIAREEGIVKSLYNALSKNSQSIRGRIGPQIATYQFSKGFKDSADSNYFKPSQDT